MINTIAKSDIYVLFVIHNPSKETEELSFEHDCKFKDLKLFITLLAVYMKTDVDIIMYKLWYMIV